MTKLLSRKAAAAMGAVTTYIVPKLAQDAKVDLTSVFADVTGKNYVASRPAIVLGVAQSTSGKLAKDATLDDLEKVLVALDGMELEENAALPTAATKDKAKDKKGGKDSKKGMDAMPEALREHLKEKMSSDDWKKACDAMEDYEAEDDGGETDEEKKAREAKEAKDKKAKDEAGAAEKDKAKDKAAKDAEAEKEKDKEESKKAMDAALDARDQRHRETRAAERFVRAWVGDLAMDSVNSADDVYKAALEIRGVKVDGIHPSAYRAILEAQPKPNARANDDKRPALGMDASSRDAAVKHAPGLARIVAGC